MMVRVFKLMNLLHVYFGGLWFIKKVITHEKLLIQKTSKNKVQQLNIYLFNCLNGFEMKMKTCIYYTLNFFCSGFLP